MHMVNQAIQLGQLNMNVFTLFMGVAQTMTLRSFHTEKRIKYIIIQCVSSSLYTVSAHNWLYVFLRDCEIQSAQE